MRCLILILFLCSCISQKSLEREKSYSYVNRVYQNKLTKDGIIKTLGTPAKVLEDGITYNKHDTNSPQLGFFWDRNNRLETAFYLGEEKELLQIKKDISCAWVEKDVVIKKSHYVVNAKSGECKELGITYQMMEKSRAYEFRWGDNKGRNLRP